MNDHIYETHARITALGSIIAFIIHTLPEEQKGPLLRAIEIISEEKLMDNFDFSHTSDVTSETIEKMNAAYANVFKEVLNFSSQDVEPEQKNTCNSFSLIIHKGQHLLVWPFLKFAQSKLNILCLGHRVTLPVGCGQLACTALLCARMSRLVCLSSTSISWSVR
ncbi:TPA: hypothetical protein NPO59_001658 [Klebsiella pneumoniae]|nr:hypothetical protein [Klebsiella pneumoniae]HCI6585363.1 hypothetical protein [Klebsiella pneumoniae]